MLIFYANNLLFKISNINQYRSEMNTMISPSSSIDLLIELLNISNENYQINNNVTLDCMGKKIDGNLIKVV